jgi:hypothetical protein
MQKNSVYQKYFFVLTMCLAILGIWNSLPAVSQKEFASIKNQLISSTHYFSYDLQIAAIPSLHQEANIMLCFHGLGGGYDLVEGLSEIPSIKDHLIGFNFPDHHLFDQDDDLNIENISLGTIQELIPALFIMKNLIIEQKLQTINLYGFSAGGGAIINLLAILNNGDYAEILLTLGISENERKEILTAIQSGLIILDLFLLIDIADRFTMNQMIPIDSITRLKGLSLQILLHFQIEDEILSNQYDALFSQRLREVNANGTVWEIIGDDGGHNEYHESLWNKYEEVIQKLK